MDINELDNVIKKNKDSVNIVYPTDRLFNINTAKWHIIKQDFKIVKKLININDIDEDLYLLYESEYDYVTSTGKIYSYYGNGMFYPKTNSINEHNGYVYCNVYTNGKNKRRRLHVLLAKMFIPNKYPNDLKLVGHKNDIKNDYALENLYWTNNRENLKDASEKGLNKQHKAEDNPNSYPVKVLDKNTLEIVGVYGSIGECARCIENITTSFVGKMTRKDKIYKPRSRKYIYQRATYEEFEENLQLRSKALVESAQVDKSPKVFWLCNNLIGYKEKFDNQVLASKVCGIPQSTISQMIMTGERNNNWYCIYEKSITYKESSAFQNQIKLFDPLKVTRDNGEEVLVFETAKEMSDYFGLSGHNAKSYLKTGHKLMERWNVETITKAEYALYKAALTNNQTPQICTFA